MPGAHSRIKMIDFRALASKNEMNIIKTTIALLFKRIPRNDLNGEKGQAWTEGVDVIAQK